MTNAMTTTPALQNQPRRAPPERACDSHAHIFGDRAHFPLAPDASYAPPDAPADAYVAMLDRISIERGVLVQPAPYGPDNGAMIDALRRYPKRLRGVALATAETSIAELEALRDAGVKALRFSWFPAGTTRNIATVGLEALHALADRMRALGLHAQLWMPCSDFVAAAPELLRLRLPLVLDHMARCDASAGLENAAFQTLLKLLRDEDMWIKLVPHRASSHFPDYDELKPFHRAMVTARPDRALWGTDWPYVRMGDATPDAGHLLDLFDAWTPEEYRRSILVDNPAALYGFA